MGRRGVDWAGKKVCSQEKRLLPCLNSTYRSFPSVIHLRFGLLYYIIVRGPYCLSFGERIMFRRHARPRARKPNSFVSLSQSSSIPFYPPFLLLPPPSSLFLLSLPRRYFYFLSFSKEFSLSVSVLPTLYDITGSETQSSVRHSDIYV